MKKKTRLLCWGIMVGLLVIYVSISSAGPGTFKCHGNCEGCQCWGNIGVDPIDECCGTCYNRFWYGYDWVTCCVGGQGCHYINP